MRKSFISEYCKIDLKKMIFYPFFRIRIPIQCDTDPDPIHWFGKVNLFVQYVAPGADFAYLKWGRFETAWCKRRERTICHRARIIHNQILQCHLVLTIFIMVKICVLIYIKSLIQNVMYSIYYVGHSCIKGNLLPQVSK